MLKAFSQWKINSVHLKIRIIEVFDIVKIRQYSTINSYLIKILSGNIGLNIMKNRCLYF